MNKIMNKMTQSFVLFVFTLILAMNSTTIPALENSKNPADILQALTEDVMQNIKANLGQFKKHPNELYALIDRRICPYIDFVEMARWVVGRNAWRAAEPATQEAFIKAFKTLLIRSYSNSLLEYAHYHLNFMPLKSEWNTQKRVSVASRLIGEGHTLHMEYRLLREENDWKVYDIIFENVSLIQGYRAQFAKDIQKNGVKAAIETLNRKNAQNATHVHTEETAHD